MVEGVGFAITGVAKDGENFDPRHVATAKFIQKVRFIPNLRGTKSNKKLFRDLNCTKKVWKIEILVNNLT